MPYLSLGDGGESNKLVIEGAVRVEARDARCEDDTSDGHVVAADDQEGIGERGVRALRPGALAGVEAAFLADPVKTAAVAKWEAAEDVGDAMAVGELQNCADLRFFNEPVLPTDVVDADGNQRGVAGMDPSLRRASAGDTLGSTFEAGMRPKPRDCDPP